MMQVQEAPLTAAARGVAVSLGCTVLAIAGLTAAGVMRPAFRNEPGVVAVGFLLGSLCAAGGLWRNEPSRGALLWILVDALLAAAALAFPATLGLA